MTTKKQIVANWLPRYTGVALNKFGKYILLVNFQAYVDMFASIHNVTVNGLDKAMPSATAKGITIINFSMGSANAATIMDLLTAIKPKAVLFLGKVGGLKQNKVGDFILPIAAIRGEGTSDDYLLPEVPALPAFNLQKSVSSVMNRKYNQEYWTGTVYTTNRRVWEHDKQFKSKLKKTRAIAIDMETATIFTVGFHNHIPSGALHLVSDMPMNPEGVKTTKSDTYVSANYARMHLKMGIDSLIELKKRGKSVKHLRFEDE